MVGGRNKSLFVIIYLTKVVFPCLSLLIFPTFHPWNPMTSCFISPWPVPINVLSVPGRWHVTSTRHRESENSGGWKEFLDVIWSDIYLDQGKLTSGCWGPCSVESCISPRMESPQPHWANFARYDHPQGGEKKPIIYQNFPCCDLWMFFLFLFLYILPNMRENKKPRAVLWVIIKREVKAGEGILPWGISSLGKPAMPRLRLIQRLGVHMPSPTSFSGSCSFLFFFSSPTAPPSLTYWEQIICNLPDTM